MRSFDVLIVGGGHAGVQLATALSKAKYPGTVALISNETVLPYERPPLSKGYLLGEEELEGILFRSAEYWEQSSVQLELGVEVVEVDPGARTVGLSSGERLGYGRLVWAAGGRARTLVLPGSDLAGIVSIRTLQDVDAVKASLDGVRRAVVIGGGFIGLESAAAFRARGIEVTVLEVADRLLARVTSPFVSDFYLDLHRRAGVDVRLAVGVSHMLGDSGRVTGVELVDGEVLPADIVIVGVGLEPLVEPLRAAGATCGNGVEVDERCRTDLDGVYAIGDCASAIHRYAEGRRMRLEAVQNATEQAKIVLCDLLDAPVTEPPVPTFWSNQYDATLKVAGVLTEYDQAIVRGDPDSGSFSVVYLREGRIVVVDCINSLPDFMQGKRLIEEGALVDPDRIHAGAPLRDGVLVS